MRSRRPVIAKMESSASRLQSDVGTMIGLPGICQAWIFARLLCVPFESLSKDNVRLDCCHKQTIQEVHCTLHHCVTQSKAHQGTVWCSHCPSARVPLGQPSIVELLLFLLWRRCLKQAAQVEQRPVCCRLLHLLHCNTDAQGSALQCRAGRGDTACVMISVTRRGRHT